MAPDTRLHDELLLDINPDCAQFCPVEWTRRQQKQRRSGAVATAAGADDDENDEEEAGEEARPEEDWLAVATYELNEATRTRRGALLLYTLTEREGGAGATAGAAAGAAAVERPRQRRRLALSARTDGLPGVFDAQWLRLPPGWAAGGGAEWGVGLALSDGRLVVMAVEAGGEGEQGEGDDVQRGDADADTDADAHGRPSPPSALRLKQVAEWQAIRGPEGLEDVATKRMALMVAWERPGPERAAVSGSGGTVAVMATAAEGRGGGGGGGGGGGTGASGAGAGADANGGGWTEWRAHELEAWAVAFDPWRRPALYTGSDDASLKLWDLRVARRSSGCDGGGSGGGGGGRLAAAPALLLCDKRSHSAGVTCISPHPSREHILATGSYDEKARLWDVRRPRCPLAELDVGGGAWRLQWRPPARPARGGGGGGGGEGGEGGDGDLLLAACMYSGFSVLRAMFGGDGEAGDQRLEVVERYEAHESIAYGCDWWRGGGRGGGGGSGEGGSKRGSARRGDDGVVCATASFYDRRLHLWSPNTVASATGL